MTAPAIPGGRYLRGAQDPPPEQDVAGLGPLAGRPHGGGLRAWPAASGRWFLLVWLLALIVFAVNDPGRMIFDTKLGVDIDAAGFYAHLWPLWNPLEWFGTLQNQYIGYAIPMGPFFLAGQLLRIPVWVIERLWLSLLVAVGYWGMAKLATALRIGSDGSRLLAGIIFATWPTFTIVIGSTSAAALPGLLAPWAVLPLVAALAGRRSIVMACARSGAAVLLMGGVNAVSTICALVLPALFIVTHSRGRQRVKVCLCWMAAVAGATAWWAGPLLLQGRDSFMTCPSSYGCAWPLAWPRWRRWPATQVRSAGRCTGSPTACSTERSPRSAASASWSRWSRWRSRLAWRTCSAAPGSGPSPA